jgi:hypothetical protein
MKEVNYPPLKIVVTGNDEPVILPPDRAEFNQLVGVCPSSDGFLCFSDSPVDLVRPNFVLIGTLDAPHLVCLFP